MDFFNTNCRTTSSRKRFGIVDHKPAKIDEQNGASWAVVIENDLRKSVIFQAVDHCVQFEKLAGKDVKRCDGFLSYDGKVVFIEIKESRQKGNNWIEEAEQQLRTSIGYFEKVDAEGITAKEAIIANKKKPYFGSSQVVRMERFVKETTYILEFKSRIVID